MKYNIELVWNREFNWSSWSDPYDSVKLAKASAQSLADSGDGARVKKWRIVDEDGQVVYPVYKRDSREEIT
jgi:hypothetical protein